MNYEYDIFLSHNNADKVWVEKLASDIENNSYGIPLKVFFDKWDIKPGADIPQELERGLEVSRFIGLVMSPEALNSNWVALERSTAIYRDPSAREKTLIPILRRDCTIPIMLKRINYIDFTLDENYSDSLNILLSILLNKELPRGKNISFEQISLKEDSKMIKKYEILFERPAFRMSCIDELSLSELSDAIDDIQTALNTGKLYTRNHNLVGELPNYKEYYNNNYTNNFTQIISILTELKRDIHCLNSIFRSKMDMSEYHYGCIPYNQIMICNLDCIKDKSTVDMCIQLMDQIDNKRNRILNIMNSLTVDNHFPLIKLSSCLIEEYGMTNRVNRT